MQRTMKNLTFMAGYVKCIITSQKWPTNGPASYIAPEQKTIPKMAHN